MEEINRTIVVNLLMNLRKDLISKYVNDLHLNEIEKSKYERLKNSFMNMLQDTPSYFYVYKNDIETKNKFELLVQEFDSDTVNDLKDTQNKYNFIDKFIDKLYNDKQIQHDIKISKLLDSDMLLNVILPWYVKKNRIYEFRPLFQGFLYKFIGSEKPRQQRDPKVFFDLNSVVHE